MWTFKDLEFQKTLILGEVHAGKTQLTQKLLEEAEALKKEIVVIDMAPEPCNNVGGKLVPSSQITRYYTTDIETPRLSGESEKEVVELAELNKKRIEKIFEECALSEVLFINDVSIYLQRGKVSTLVSVISSFLTCIMNGYYGTFLGEDLFSLEERRKMMELQKFCNRIIWK